MSNQWSHVGKAHGKWDTATQMPTSDPIWMKNQTTGLKVAEHI